MTLNRIATDSLYLKEFCVDTDLDLEMQLQTMFSFQIYFESFD